MNTNDERSTLVIDADHDCIATEIEQMEFMRNVDLEANITTDLSEICNARGIYEVDLKSTRITAPYLCQSLIEKLGNPHLIVDVDAADDKNDIYIRVDLLLAWMFQDFDGLRENSFDGFSDYLGENTAALTRIVTDMYDYDRLPSPMIYTEDAETAWITRRTAQQAVEQLGNPDWCDERLLAIDTVFAKADWLSRLVLNSQWIVER